MRNGKVHDPTLRSLRYRIKTVKLMFLSSRQREFLMILSYKVKFFYTPGASLFCCCFFLWFCFFFKEEEEEGSGHICLIEKDACFFKKKKQSFSLF